MGGARGRRSKGVAAADEAATVVRVRVRVKPGSTAGPAVEEGADGVLTVRVRERAAGGAANAGVVAALADHWGVPGGAVTIVAGHTARVKTVTVTR